VDSDGRGPQRWLATVVADLFLVTLPDMESDPAFRRIDLHLAAELRRQNQFLG
jgi:hypothetical protein